MATAEPPLLTRVALSECWSEGWLLLRSAGTWPAPQDVTDDLCGKHGWAGRRRAMHQIADSLAGHEDPGLWRAARLLATEPNNPAACRDIADMLAAELSQHDRIEAAADIIKGWKLLSENWFETVDNDPIKASRLAADISRAMGLPSCVDSSSPDEYADAIVVDDWEFVEIPGSKYRAVRGVISGDGLKYESGQVFTTSAILKNDVDMTRIRTAEAVYRLGYKLSDQPPIVRAILKGSWRSAWNLILGLTGEHTLSGSVLDSAKSAGGKGSGERHWRAKAVADALHAAGRRLLAHAWYLLAADCDHIDTVILANSFLTAAASGSTSPEVRVTVAGWRMLADGKTDGVDLSDPVAAAHNLACGEFERREPGESKDAPSGIMVLKCVGGTRETSTAKEAQREFKDIVGKRMPLTRAPDLARVSRVLHDEFPHAQRQVDTLLTGMVTGEPIRWRSAIIVGSPGAGKSRLVRRLSEELRAGLHRFDAAGSADNAFGGTPRRWSSGQHCTPLEAVRRHRAANPLIMIDEIDKGGTSRHNGNAVGALLPFMDTETARAYPDPYVDSDVDLSHVGYMLTCNEEISLPGPLRDRLLTIRIPDPGIEHMPALIRCIVADIAREQGGDRRWFPDFDDGELAVAEKLWRKGGSVRRLRAIVERIVAYRESKPRN